MTVRLYDRDVDMLEFSAVVKTCEQREKGYIVTLDQTAFFPGPTSCLGKYWRLACKSLSRPVEGLYRALLSQP